ncbi:MAG: hypothetical protein AAF936_03880 [Pseudomonadota bacterium]
MPLIKGCCIFCGQKGGLTKEHIWSDFLKSELRDSDFFYRGSTKKTETGGAFNRFRRVETDRRNGPIHKSKVRKVCEKCNNGWMSRAVEVAKPAALRLVRDEPTILSIEDQAKLALWIAICATVLDARDPTKCLMDQSQRLNIMDSLQPAPSSKIFIGRFDCDPNEETIVDRNTLRFLHPFPSGYWIYTLAYVIKNLFVFVGLSGEEFGTAKTFNDNPPHISRIFPPQNEAIEVSALPKINHAMGDDISRGLVMNIKIGLKQRGIPFQAV